MTDLGGRIRILVVDDEPVMRMVAQTVLTQHDFDVTAAQSAEEALELIQQGYQPNMILLDVLMPGMSGFDACRLLRREAQFANLPIIMLTGLDDQVSIDEAYGCGATDFITKPLNIPLLPHRLRYLLRSAGAFQALVQSQTVLQRTQRIARLGSWTLNRSGALVEASQEYLDIVGQERVPLPAHVLHARVHPQELDLFLESRSRLRNGHTYQIDYRLRSANESDEWCHVHERGFPRLGPKGDYLGADGFTQDITERVVQEERIRYLAWFDQVTGLNNRNHMQELLEQELALDMGHMRRTLAFMHVANLRHFVSVFGQDMGDAVLRVLAGRITGLAERPETYAKRMSLSAIRQSKLARYDEYSFVVFLPTPGETVDMRDECETLLDSLCQPMVLEGQEFIPQVYMGIVNYPDNAHSAAELLRRAMLVTLQAASAERDRIIFYAAEHDRAASHRLALERGLRQALEEGGQLMPYFQPKISARTGQVVGAEVLLRWRHPELGMVPPSEFIPVAERCGLIFPISEWLIRTVCERLAEWREWRDHIGVVSVNMSAEGFFLHDLEALFDQVFTQTGVAAESLTVELTESVLMQNAEVAKVVISKLRQRGLRISLDDFGTGFSSLGYLNHFSIDEIKIDRSFVQHLQADTREAALVQAIISLGHALGLEVVAEGVETAAQADILRRMGCDIFQGYFFARPMPDTDFLDFCRRAAH